MAGATVITYCVVALGVGGLGGLGPCLWYSDGWTRRSRGPHIVCPSVRNRIVSEYRGV